MDYEKRSTMNADLPCMIYLCFYQIVSTPYNHFIEVLKTELYVNIERKTGIWFMKLYVLNKSQYSP